MMNMKKAIATLTATMILTTSAVSVASAGGIGDFFSGIGGTIAHGLKTAYHAVVDTGEYVFTDKSGEECYAETCESAGKVKKNAGDVCDGAVKTVKDVVEFQMGVVQTVGGAVATGVMAATEGVTNLVTGKEDYSWTNAAKGFMKDGYDHMDNGFDTMVEAVTLVNPVAGVIANGVKLAKTAGEAAVGYKDRNFDNFGQTVLDTGINMAAGAVGAGMAARVSSSAAISAGTAGKALAAGVGGAAKATMKIAKDMKYDTKRSGVDIVMEDLFTAAAGTAAGAGAGAAVAR